MGFISAVEPPKGGVGLLWVVGAPRAGMAVELANTWGLLLVYWAGILLVGGVVASDKGVALEVAVVQPVPSLFGAPTRQRVTVRVILARTARALQVVIQTAPMVSQGVVDCKAV